MTFLNKKQLNAISSHLLKDIKENNTFSLPQSINEKINNTHQKIIIEIRSYYIFRKTKRVILENRTLSDENVKQTWWGYLRPLWRILKTFEKNYQADANNRRITRRRGRGLRLFTILPHSKLQKRFVLIDSTALYRLLSATNHCGLGKISLDDFNENLEHWWKMAFNIDKVTTTNRRFGFSIMTDGMSVSVNLRRVTVKDNIKVNSYGFDEDKNFYPLNISKDDRVVGLDPGRKDLFVAVYGDEKKNFKKCSTKEWYSLVGFTRIRKTKEIWIKNNNMVSNILSSEYCNH